MSVVKPLAAEVALDDLPGDVAPAALDDFGVAVDGVALLAAGAVFGFAAGAFGALAVGAVCGVVAGAAGVAEVCRAFAFVATIAPL